jgi:hypothetical protein
VKDVVSRAEVALDYPDKTYIGFFDRHSRYAVEADGRNVILKLEHRGDERKVVDIHLEYPLLAAVLEDFTALHASHKAMQPGEREHLVRSLKGLVAALAKAH